MNKITKIVLCNILGFAVLCFFLNQRQRDNSLPPLISGDAYLKLALNGKIDTVYKYDKGTPIILIKGKRLYPRIPTACKYYLRKGDSLVKQQDELYLKTYRDSGAFIQRIAWGYGDSATAVGLISEKMIKK
ncbi:hypothetical protein MON38_18680 [Hymenobacter sp. DH14]|uniref:Uncharacterized protein n=1 Tax=Hymenobacter cyanobacteriorum TaxID=2926463 RepID=A0A9X1VJQ7_9BACT|nr:hypothetical protein [Hymenobacter cyanobacteriorum]MCI1189453.1 hypothetical protein [Hymenobacter cyanobacteriorum]